MYAGVLMLHLKNMVIVNTAYDWTFSQTVLPRFDGSLIMFILVWFAIFIAWLFYGALAMRRLFNSQSSTQTGLSLISKFKCLFSYFIVDVACLESKNSDICSIAMMANLFGIAAASAHFVW